MHHFKICNFCDNILTKYMLIRHYTVLMIFFCRILWRNSAPETPCASLTLGSIISVCLTCTLSLCRWTTSYGTCAVSNVLSAGRRYVSTAAATSKTKRSSVKWIISGRVSLWPCFQNTTSTLLCQHTPPPLFLSLTHTHTLPLRWMRVASCVLERPLQKRLKVCNKIKV